MRTDDFWQATKQILEAFRPILIFSLALYMASYIIGGLSRFFTPKAPPPHVPTEAELRAERANEQFRERYHAVQHAKAVSKRFHAASRKARQGRIE